MASLPGPSFFGDYASFTPLSRPDLRHRLRDFDRVQRPAAGEVVYHGPEPETLSGLVLAHGAEEDFVAGGGVERPQEAGFVGRLEEGVLRESLAERLQAGSRAAH